MAEKVAIRDGGKTSEEGAMRFLRQFSSNGEGVITTDSLEVTERGAGANKSVDIATGDIGIAYQDYCYYAFNESAYNVVITNNTSGNPRIDTIVAYIDRSVVDDTDNDNPDALKFAAVVGTPAGSPAAPNDAAIDSAVGASNPWYRLATVAVANGFSSIVSANITDLRQRMLLGNSGALPPFGSVGTQLVQNGIGNNWIVPPGVSAINRLDIVALTAPVGSSLTMRLYNVTQARDIGTVSLTAGSRIASNSSMTNASVNEQDEVRLDCTAIGSTTPGADVTVQPSA